MWLLTCRPTEIIHLLVPLTWGLTSWVALLARHAAQLALAGAVGLAVLSLQLFFWHATSGQWILYSYGNERFDFLHPHIVDGLFSYRKGGLLHTPLVGVMLLGLPGARRVVPAVVAPVLLFLPVLVYVTFSWGQWAYGGGFSARPLVSVYPLLALPLAAVLRGRQTAAWAATLHTLVALCIVLNLWQPWQYAAGILLADDNTAELYWRNFFHTSI